MLYYYLIYSMIGLMTLSIALIRKISLAVIKIEILQALNCQLQRRIELIVTLNRKSG